MLQIVSCKPSEEFDMAGGSLQTRDLSGCAGFRHQTFALSCIRADNQSLSQKWSGIKRKIRDTFKSSSLLLLRFAFHSGFLLRHHLAFYHDPSPSFLLKIWSSGSQSTQFLARPRGLLQPYLLCPRKWPPCSFIFGCEGLLDYQLLLIDQGFGQFYSICVWTLFHPSNLNPSPDDAMGNPSFSLNTDNESSIPSLPGFP